MVVLVSKAYSRRIKLYLERHNISAYFLNQRGVGTVKQFALGKFLNLRNNIYLTRENGTTDEGQNENRKSCMRLKKKICANVILFLVLVYRGIDGCTNRSIGEVTKTLQTHPCPIQFYSIARSE